MKLIQLLQEASDLSLDDLKKAMTKDKRVAMIFSKDLKLEDIEDKAAFLKTLKYYLFNNQNVLSFVKSRSNGNTALSADAFARFRKLTPEDLTETRLEFIQVLVQTVFKEHVTTQKGTISKYAKKDIEEWVNANSGYHDLRKSTQDELMSIPGIRPDHKIVVYRGVLFAEHSLKERERYDGTMEKGNGLKFLEMIRDGGKTVDLEWAKPSAWTTSKDVAEKFAKYGPAESNFAATLQWLERGSKKAAIDGALGYVVSTLADPKDILIDLQMYNATIKSQHGSESEVILKPGTYLARVVKKFTVKGEVDPALPDEDVSELPAAKAVGVVKELKTATDLPDETSILDEYKDKWRYDAGDLLANMPAFKKLATTGTTTSVNHAFDKLMKIYNENLSHLSDDDIRADKFASNPQVRKNVDKLKDLIGRFTDQVSHSKFSTPENRQAKGKTHLLSGEEYRQTITPHDIRQLERDLLTRGAVTSSDTARYLQSIAAAVGTQVPSVSHFAQRGAAKQKPVIDSVVDHFYSKLGVDKPGDESEALKGMINIIKKASRNYQMLKLIKSTHDLMGDLD
jgi:hypothetical protein